MHTVLTWEDLSKSLRIWEVILSHHMILVSWCVLRDRRRCMVQCDNGLCNKGSFVNPERWVRSPLCSPQEMKHHWISMSRLFSESPSRSYLVCLGDSEISFPTKQILTFVSALETLTLKRMWISLGAISRLFLQGAFLRFAASVGRTPCFSERIKTTEPFLFSHVTYYKCFIWLKSTVSGRIWMPLKCWPRFGSNFLLLFLSLSLTLSPSPFQMYEMHESRCTLEESAIPHCPCKMFRYVHTLHLGSILCPALPRALSLGLSPLLEWCQPLNPTAATLVGSRDLSTPSTTGWDIGYFVQAKCTRVYGYWSILVIITEKNTSENKTDLLACFFLENLYPK